MPTTMFQPGTRVYVAPYGYGTTAMGSCGIGVIFDTWNQGHSLGIPDVCPPGHGYYVPLDASNLVDDFADAQLSAPDLSELLL